MKLTSKHYWLPQAIDVKIIDKPSVTGAGFCTIVSADFYEDEPFETEELATFTDVHDAFSWLATKGYVAVDEGCADGLYRHRDAAEWCYQQIDKKPVRVLKKYKTERAPMSPERQRILLMLSA